MGVVRDWEARFANSELESPKKSLSSLVLFSWGALAVSLVYAALVTWVLIGVSRDGDGEEKAAAWIIFGLPWILGCGRYYWLAVPLNAATVYFVVVGIMSICRSIFPRRREG
jgi:hypothetical protein